MMTNMIKKTNLFKKILRGFFYVYGIIGFPLAYIAYNWQLPGYCHKRSFLQLIFKAKMRVSCAYLTFFVNFPLCIFLLIEMEKWFPVLKEYTKFSQGVQCFVSFHQKKEHYSHVIRHQHILE